MREWSARGEARKSYTMFEAEQGNGRTFLKNNQGSFRFLLNCAAYWETRGCIADPFESVCVRVRFLGDALAAEFSSRHEFGFLLLTEPLVAAMFFRMISSTWRFLFGRGRLASAIAIGWISWNSISLGQNPTGPLTSLPMIAKDAPGEASSLPLTEPLLGSSQETLHQIPAESSTELTEASRAQDPFTRCRDEIWLVNTRCVPDGCQDCCAAENLIIRQCQDGYWVERHLEELWEACNAAPECENVVYIHGNFTDYEWSLRRGIQVYNTWFGCCGESRPIRFIIWSWRSEREAVPGRDFHIKSQRAVAEGCRLNSLVSRLGPRSPIVVGYSLGAQATLSALSQADLGSGRPWRVALIAAAFDACFCCSFESGQQICGRLQKLVLFTNASDPALNCSERLARRRIPGCPFNQYSIEGCLPELRERLEQYEIRCEVGHHHTIARYRQAPTVVALVQELIRDEASWSAEADPPVRDPGPE